MTVDIENCECRYFVTYSGVKLPLKMVNPLVGEELENRNTFFRAYFDELDRLLVCQKMVYSEIELEHRYCYYANGSLKQAEITDADGEITVLDFPETES
jgi:hypothetical protein